MLNISDVSCFVILFTLLHEFPLAEYKALLCCIVTSSKCASCTDSVPGS